MNRRSMYIATVALIFFISFFVIKKIKQHHLPDINLDGLSLNGMDGAAINATAFAGKPLVINFWGTWCGPCLRELPVFDNATVKYGDKITIVTVSDEALEKLAAFKTANNYNFLSAQSQQSFQQMGITSVPFTYFYDASGKLIYKKKDPLTEASLNELIDKLLKK